MDMDKDLIIVALICISAASFFLWHQWSIAELHDNNLKNVANFYLALKGNSIETNSSTIKFAGRNMAVITSPGTYEISGCLADGQIIVDTQDSGTVKLILKGVSINCSRSAPICIWRASKVVIFLEAGTENLVSDGASYLFANLTDNEPNAAIFSKADLIISGEGMLKVIGNYKDGIASKDSLTIESGTIMVQAVDDGIRGKDCLIIRGGTLILDVGGDGLKSDNTLNAALGYITVEKGGNNRKF